MIHEGELRELLKEIILEMYGLTPEKPKTTRIPQRASRDIKRPTFSRGSAPKPSPFKRESSAIPNRQKILVGTSVRLSDTGRRGPGERMPGESDRDFIERRAKIRQAHRLGLAPPSDDKSSPYRERWEMGH